MMKTKSGVCLKSDGAGRLAAATDGKSPASDAKHGAGLASVLLAIALLLVACAPETGAPVDANVGESEAQLSTAGMHGFMLTSDADNTLAVTAVGAVNGTTLKVYKGCTWENPECTWSYVNGMIVSDADPTLAINAWGGAGEGVVLRLSNICTTSNTSCTWTYSHGEFLSDANLSLAINSWGGGHPGETLKLTSTCSSSNTSCTWTMHRAMLFSNTGTTLAWNAWGGAAEGANVRLSDICSRTNTSCTWTVKKGNIITDGNSGLGVIGGSTNLTQLQTTGFCAPPNTNTTCTWTFKHGQIISDAASTLVVNAFGGIAAGAFLKVNTACTLSNTSCLFSAQVGGPQCVGSLEPSCPGAPDPITSVVHQDSVIANILADERAAHPEIPAIAAAIVIDGQIHLATAGKRKWTDTSDTLQETDQFEADSIAKAVSGSLMAIAVDRGIMSWSDTLGQDSAYQGVSGAYSQYLNVTLAELNAHAGGMWADTGAHQCGGCTLGSPDPTCVLCQANGYNPNSAAASDYSALSTPALRRIAITQDSMRDLPLFTPGGGYIYGGDTIYAISLLENKTSAAYLPLVKDWIFKPLDMAHSGTLPDVWQHNWNSAGSGTMSMVAPAQEQSNPRLGVGGISMSIEDAARFIHAAMHSATATGHLWSDATQQTIMQGVEHSNYTPHAFSMNMNESAGGPEIWKDGCDLNGNNSIVSTWPRRKVALIVMTNYATLTTCDTVLGEVYGKLVTALSVSYGLSAPPFPYTSAPTYHATTVTSTPASASASNAVDGVYGTSWAVSDGTTSASLSVTLSAASSIGHIYLSEVGDVPSTPATSSAIGGGASNQLRSNSYQVWLTVGAVESLVASGYTIGFDRLITIPTMTGVTKARLAVTGTNAPIISEFHVMP
ncbi:MAG: serine hydrolase domain-containing protein [Byssovorax sp.]